MDNKQALLANMHTFSVAARLLSFTKAGEELCLTQGAVSHRIKNLEKHLGFSVFVRLTRRLELTTEGQRLLGTLNHSFADIFSEVEDIRFNELRGELYIGASPTFALAWLMPKLPSFQKLYPNLNVKIRIKASKLDFKHEPVDLAIYYGNEEHSDLHCQRLFSEKLMPVCTPEYAQQFALTDNIENLQGVTFIHCIESLESISPNHEWSTWLKSNSLDLDSEQRQYQFNHCEMAIVAARQGMGIAMGRAELIHSHIESGELIAPFTAVDAGLGYDLICSKGQEVRPKYQAFLNWILAHNQ
ncbi:LysR substrate-binding domain-containing protein [Psychromonas ossibalaenae]|uniref:LysR substrate-binding domain-containing protein n=1 Tax=Psychromonas ossibalaenae TaxID=444922 RepID=UPI0003800801|nr:LysR substrate-binding domain-containing protein [Psychromonas ossibalaenae]